MYRNMLFVTVGALFITLSTTTNEANAASLIPPTNNNIMEYKIAAMQFLPDAKDSEPGFGGKKNIGGDYNKGEQTTKGCSEGSSNRCAGGQVATRSYRAPNGTTCYVCETSNAQKCLDKGFKKQEDWPKPTTTGWNTPLKQDNVFFAFFNNLLGIKNANALLVLEEADDPILAKPPIFDDSVVNPDKPILVDGPVFEKPTSDGIWEFQISSTCDEDQSYVKGEWKFTPRSCDVVNCAACKIGTSYTCSLCKPGYRLSSGMCSLITVANCASYNSARDCIACASGYRLSSGSCISGPSCVTTYCDGIKYCCPSGVNCSTMQAGGLQCFMEAFDDMPVR